VILPETGSATMSKTVASLLQDTEIFKQIHRSSLRAPPHLLVVYVRAVQIPGASSSGILNVPPGRLI
jgi:hypothetical protein